MGQQNNAQKPQKVPILLTFSAFHSVPRNPKKNIQFQPKCRHFCRQKSAQIGCIIISKLYIHFGLKAVFCIVSLASEMDMRFFRLMSRKDAKPKSGK